MPAVVEVSPAHIRALREVLLGDRRRGAPMVPASQALELNNGPEPGSLFASTPTGLYVLGAGGGWTYYRRGDSCQ